MKYSWVYKKGMGKSGEKKKRLVENKGRVNKRSVFKKRIWCKKRVVAKSP